MIRFLCSRDLTYSICVHTNGVPGLSKALQFLQHAQMAELKSKMCTYGLPTQNKILQTKNPAGLLPAKSVRVFHVERKPIYLRCWWRAKCRPSR